MRTVASAHHCQVRIDGNRDPSAVGIIGLELTRGSIGLPTRWYQITCGIAGGDLVANRADRGYAPRSELKVVRNMSTPVFTVAERRGAVYRVGSTSCSPWQRQQHSVLATENDGATTV